MDRNRYRRALAVFGLAGALVASSLALGGSAEARSRGAIKFKRGKSAGTVSATAKYGNPDCWTFGARYGQRVSFVVSGNVKASILEVGFTADDPVQLQDEIDEYGGRSTAQSIVDDGTQILCVAALRSFAPYRLTLTIV